MKTGRDVVDRGAARRRRVRLLDRAADRDGLHHDARLPPEHLPGRRRDPGPGAARALPRHPGPRRQLPDERRRGGPPADGAARRPPLRGPDRPHRAARHGRRDRPLEGRRRSTSRWCSRSPDVPGRRRPPPHPRPRAGARRRARLGAGRASCAPALEQRRAGQARSDRPCATSTARSAASSRARSPVASAPTGCPRARSRSRSPARPGRASAPGWRPA